MCQKQKYAPSVFEKYVATVSIGGKEIKLNLYDTAGKTKKSVINSHIYDSTLHYISHYVERHLGSEPAELEGHTLSGKQ